MTTRDRILDAAAKLLRTHGVARATTKEIARAAGFSEATLYKHFRDKEELILHVLGERTPGLSGLRGRPGEGTVAENIVDVARSALVYYQQVFPMLGSMLGDPGLMAASRESMRKYDGGPKNPVARFAEYLRAEQKLGRIAADADLESAASLLIGACFQQAFLRYYEGGPDAPPASEETAAALARSLTLGLPVNN